MWGVSWLIYFSHSVLGEDTLGLKTSNVSVTLGKKSQEAIHITEPLCLPTSLLVSCISQLFPSAV